MVTGGDKITARFLHKEFFDFWPTHKLWVQGNYKPVIRGTDNAIWNRVSG
jgi:putative DNA primase/helicase